MIEHRIMSLFDAPEHSIIVHACNSQGVWGSGIAKPFKENYPKSFVDYHHFCKTENDRRGSATGLSGLSSLDKSEKHWVGWLVTSHDYGPKKDSPEQIKINTTLALMSFCTQLYKAHLDKTQPIEVYSNKFNSGLFAVPWNESELILKTVLKNFKRINWVVCEQ